MCARIRGNSLRERSAGEQQEENRCFAMHGRVDTAEGCLFLGREDSVLSGFVDLFDHKDGSGAFLRSELQADGGRQA
jgi:hypothetical protein